jgi:small subunit ribosomal protein S17
MSVAWKAGLAEALVVAKRTSKTVKVAIRRKVIHRKYHWVKYMRSYLLAHDEFNQCVPGDKVVIKQSRPYSALKKFAIVEISEKYKPADFLRKHPELHPDGITDRTDAPLPKSVKVGHAGPKL